MRQLKTGLMLLVAVLALVRGTAASALTPPPHISMHREDIAIESVLGLLKSEYGVSFVLNAEGIDLSRKVSVHADSEPLETFVKNLFQPQAVNVKVIGSTVTVTAAVTRPVKGVFKGSVLDPEGNPVIGAALLSADGKVGITTDLDGNFSVEAPGESLPVTVTAMGYQALEYVLHSGRTEKIYLQDETTILDEVVVIGYGTLSKKEMTSAISHLGEKDFNHVSSLDASMLLQGKVSSVSISNTALADPNNYGSIQIRGVSSRNAGMDPLIVVDGVPGGDLTNINPADIQSFDVLKDGAASAIYGTRASNGVILINLKKGTKDGRVHTSYSATVTVNQPKRELDIMDAAQYRAYRCVTNPLADLGGSTDWFDAATRTGFSHMHTVSLSGGDERTSYRATVDYRNANGIDLRSDRREYSTRANINHTTKGGLFTFSASVAPRMIHRNTDAGVMNRILINNPTIPVYDDREADGYYRVPAGSESSNIVETMKMVEGSSDIKLLDWNASAQANLLPLLFPARPDMSLTSKATFSQYAVDKFNGGWSPSVYGPNINSGTTGVASRSYSNSRTDNFEWVTNFSARFREHQVRVMAGYSYMYGASADFSASNSNFDTDVTTYNSIGSGAEAAKDGIVGMGSSKSDHKLIGFFARVNYDWKQRYILSASFRHEGSSRFGINHKWGNFPAVSAGWRISDEPFLKRVSWIDDLKFRYDFGITGNEDIGNYHSLSSYRAFGYFQYEGTRFHVWGPSANTNTELRWEKGYNQNIGLDFSLFRYRLNGSLNYYIRRQVDLLGDYAVSVPPNLFDTIYANVGTLRNTGLEVDITFNAVRKRDFNWDITLVGATNDNRFISFSNDVYTGESYYYTCLMANPNNPGYLQRIEEGKRIGNYFTYRYAGVDNNGDWLIYDKKGNVIPIAEGTTEDKAVTGNGLPVFTGSLSTSIVWKNLDVNLSLRGAAGFELFNVHDFYFGLQSSTYNQLTSAWAKNAHVTTGKNIITDYFIEPGSYLKIDNVTVGYTFPVNRRFLDKVRIFATGNNLFTFTRFTGIDPSNYEYNGLTPGTFGGAYTYYPSVFQFIFGAQVNF